MTSAVADVSVGLHRREAHGVESGPRAGWHYACYRSKSVDDDNTDMLMVGMPVWVDGTKHGRIAYLGEVHFAKGDMAGVHLDSPVGKNNGSVGGVLYFQCEPKRGIFSRLHRLALRRIE